MSRKRSLKKNHLISLFMETDINNEEYNDLLSVKNTHYVRFVNLKPIVDLVIQNVHGTTESLDLPESAINFETRDKPIIEWFKNYLWFLLREYSTKNSAMIHLQEDQDLGGTDATPYFMTKIKECTEGVADESEMFKALTS